MFQELEKSEQIRTCDWNKYNTWSGWKDENDIPFVPKGRTVRELQELQERALREFYLRPAVVFRFLTTLRSLSDIRKYLLGFWILVRSRFL